MWNSADFEVLAEQIRRRRTLERDSEDELVEQIPVLARAERRRTPVFHAHEPALLETSNALPADTAADSEVGREIHLPGQDVPGREPAGDDLAGELRHRRAVKSYHRRANHTITGRATAWWEVGDPHRRLTIDGERALSLDNRRALW